MKSNIGSIFRENNLKRISQGDVLRDVAFSVGALNSNNSEEIRMLYLVVMSQECDLEHDFNASQTNSENQDKLLEHILVCPAYPFESFVSGEHIQNSNRRDFRDKKNKQINILMNNDEYKRYHYLTKEDGTNLPPLVIDFKHYYTVPRGLLYQFIDNRVTSINELFREDLSRRFANFLARIGLPEL